MTITMLELTSSPWLSAHGSATVTVRPAVWVRKPVRLLSAHGSGRATARLVEIERTVPPGGLTDLGMWDVAQPDTAMARVLGQASPTETSTATRAHLTTTAPARYQRGGAPLWNAAAYAGVSVNWLSTPNNHSSAWQQVMLEPAPLGNRLSWDATSWENGPCYIGRYDSTYSTVTRTTRYSLSGVASGRMVYEGGPETIWGYWMNPIAPSGMAPCVPGEIISGSVAVKMQRQAWWSAGLQFYDADYGLVGPVYWQSNGVKQHPGGNVWDTSFAYRIPAPEDAVWVAVVPHISTNSTPDARDQIAEIGEVAYVDMHRIWGPAYQVSSVPTVYKPPRKLTVDVKANRVNLVRNPSITADIAGWGVAGTGTLPFPLARDASKGRQKSGALRMTLPENLSAFSGVGEQVVIGSITGFSVPAALGTGIKPRTFYMTSLYVRRSANCPNVTLLADMPEGEFVRGVLSTDEAANHPELIEGEWVRLWGLRYPEDNDDGLVRVVIGVNSADVDADCAFWVDDVLVEETAHLKPYFDGDTPGSGYLWAGTPNFSSSHYYRGFKSQAYRLRDIVQASVPHGTQVEIRYARPPE